MWKSASLVYIRSRTAAGAVPFVNVLVLYFLASAASFSTTVICISGFAVVRWCLTWSFRERMVSEDSTCIAAHEASSAAAAAACSREERCAVCGKLSKFHAKQNNDFVPIRTRKNPATSKTHPHQKAFFNLWKLPIWTSELEAHEW